MIAVNIEARIAIEAMTLTSGVLFMNVLVFVRVCAHVLMYTPVCVRLVVVQRDF